MTTRKNTVTSKADLLYDSITPAFLKPEHKHLVTEGATVKCKFGSETAILYSSTFGPPIKAGSQPALTIKDKNIMPKTFGICNKLTKKSKKGKQIKCKPDFEDKWGGGDESTCLTSIPALNKACKLGCKIGTTESIFLLTSGQIGTDILAEEEKEVRNFEKELKGRTRVYFDFGNGVRQWIWLKNPRFCSQDDLQFNKHYREFFEGQTWRAGHKNVYAYEEPEPDMYTEQLITARKELETGRNAQNGAKLTGIEKAQRWSIIASAMATTVITTYWAGKSLSKTNAKTNSMIKKNKKKAFDSKQSILEKASGADTTSKDLSQFEKLKGEYASKEIPNADRIGSGLKDDPIHRAASFITEEQLAKGRVTSYTGSDNKSYSVLQTKGNFNGLDGIYEYILDSTGKITHQRFIKGGKITGFPNQKVHKGGY